MNEYHEAFQDLRSNSTFKGEQWFGKRQELVEKYSWAVPNEDAIVYLCGFDELVELGAGSGYWANCVQENGGSVTPVDIDPPVGAWTEVTRADVADVAHKLEDKPVLMVWPPCDNNMALQVAEAQPSHILYVGEPRGGCTGTEAFFDTLDEQYGLVAKIDIPSYAGINDDLFHYVRKV